MYILKTAALAAALCAGATSAFGATILSTDFDGRSVSGATASNITWVTNGVADPGDLTVVSPGSPTVELFDTTNAQDRFAVNRNIQNEAPWSLDISLAVLGGELTLDELALDVFTFNNSGNLQGQKRDADYTVDILRVSDSFSLFSETVNDVDELNGSSAGPYAVSYDLTGVTLAANTDYTLRITAVSDGPFGNNTGFDNFSLSGAVGLSNTAPVPLPAGLPLVITGLIALAAIRRRA